MIKIKRIYGEPSLDDGVRVLVDRIWPRGISKEKAKIDFWRKDLAPSSALRKWFNHDPAKFAEFGCVYRSEIKAISKDGMGDIIKLVIEQHVTLVYSARSTRHNQAIVLRQILNEKILEQHQHIFRPLVNDIPK